MTEYNTNRVTCKRRHPNQLFHDVLQALGRDAAENRGSLLPSLKEAISSLEKYPLPLSSGAECAILKGFDQRLCRYIDAYLKQQRKKNKKTRCDDGFSTGKKFEKLRLSPSVEETSDIEMTSHVKKNRRNNKKVESNTDKSAVQPKSVESIHKRTADTNLPIVSLTDCNEKAIEHKSSWNDVQKIQESEQNNNKADFEVEKYLEAGTLDTYFVNRSRKDSDSKPYEEVLEDNLNNIDFSLCENWDSFTYYYPHYTNKPRPQGRTLGKLIEVLDPSDDEMTVEDISDKHSTSDIDITDEPRKQCLHNKDIVNCKECECISTAVDAFQMYFKEKTKRDEEEIVKCVLPRKMYKPAYRSAAYAILVALLEQRNECPYRDCLTKDELIQKAQKHTDQSFKNLKPESCTAWINAKRLVNRGMVQIINFDNNNEDFYMLTAMGRALAKELINERARKVTVNDVIFHGQRNDRVPSLEDVVLVPPPPTASIEDEQSSVFIEMPPGTFDIIMLIDKREDFDKTSIAKSSNYCKYESRHLTIGDFVWVARSKKTGQELVLPYIVERKRMDDLASSIKDGRFHEQKFRLRKCGLTHVIYLVEDYKKRTQYALPMASLMQAIVNTNVLEEFNVVKTESFENTFRFLESLSQILVHRFLSKFQRGCNRDTGGKELMTFNFFNKFSCKNKPLTVRDTFIKMLLQLKGLSIEKALSITQKYSTPRLLIKAYEKCTVKEGELLLANLKLNNCTRSVGPALSKTVYKLFSKEM